MAALQAKLDEKERQFDELKKEQVRAIHGTCQWGDSLQAGVCTLVPCFMGPTASGNPCRAVLHGPVLPVHMYVTPPPASLLLLCVLQFDSSQSHAFGGADDAEVKAVVGQYQAGVQVDTHPAATHVLHAPHPRVPGIRHAPTTISDGGSVHTMLHACTRYPKPSNLLPVCRKWPRRPKRLRPNRKVRCSSQRAPMLEYSECFAGLYQMVQSGVTVSVPCQSARSTL